MFSCKIGDDAELRLPQERHADEVFALIERNRAYLREWLPWLDDVKTVEDESSFIRHSLEQFATGYSISPGIWYKGRFAGFAGLGGIDTTHKQAEIGYWVSEDLQGKGLVTRACRALLDYAFDELKLNRVVIRAAPDNRRSRAVPERLGFTQECIARQAGWQYDHFIDLVVYSMLADEWRNKKSA